MHNNVLQSSLIQAREALARGDSKAAHRSFQQAHQLAPEDPDILLDLAVACLACDAPSESLVHAQAASQLISGWRLELVQANAYLLLNQADSADFHLQLAVADPALPSGSRATALKQRASLQLNAFGDARSSAVSLREAAIATPALTRDAELATLVADLYEGGRTPSQLMAGFSALAQGLEAPVTTTALHTLPRKSRKRLRIGLISQQFCASPVGFLTLGAVSALAREADLLFFDRGAKVDWAKAAFQACARHWMPCASLNNVQLYRLLNEADLDAVIDMSGWTDPYALSALTGRPARRQLKWVGGQSMSTGLQCFDGFVADRRQVPAAAAKFYTEPLLLARQSYVSYTAPPYAAGLNDAATHPPTAAGQPAPGVYALVSNPAKISPAIAADLRQLKPRKLLLLDQRWKHQGTRIAGQRRLGSLMDVAEFITPANHHEYLQALIGLDATFVDTAPYAMGLTAIELRLLGKHIKTAPRSSTALMYERHCVAHMEARRFDHHASLAAQLLEWCKS